MKDGLNKPALGPVFGARMDAAPRVVMLATFHGGSPVWWKNGGCCGNSCDRVLREGGRSRGLAWARGVFRVALVGELKGLLLGSID